MFKRNQKLSNYNNKDKLLPGVILGGIHQWAFQMIQDFLHPALEEYLHRSEIYSNFNMEMKSFQK